MGTRSTIAVVHEDNSVSQVYCHWDGYLSNNGKLLVENYNSREAAEELVSLGDISSLSETVEGTTYYGRDRGEPAEQTRAQHFADMDDYRENGQSEEFDYLFIAGAWLVRDHGEFAGAVSELLGQEQES